MYFLVQGYPIGGFDWGSRPDQGLPGYGHPDHGLPGYGHPGNRPPGSWGGPVDPGYGQGGINHPGNWVPGSANRPDNSLPGWLPPPPSWTGGWVPGGGHPGNRPPGSGNRPDAGLPGDQPGIDNALPGGVHKGEIWVVAYHPDHGFKWVRVSDIAAPGNELPDSPDTPDQGLPPTAAPKK